MLRENSAQEPPGARATRIGAILAHRQTRETSALVYWYSDYSTPAPFPQVPCCARMLEIWRKGQLCCLQFPNAHSDISVPANCNNGSPVCPHHTLLMPATSRLLAPSSLKWQELTLYGVWRTVCQHENKGLVVTFRLPVMAQSCRKVPLIF